MVGGGRGCWRWAEGGQRGMTGWRGRATCVRAWRPMLEVKGSIIEEERRGVRCVRHVDFKPCILLVHGPVKLILVIKLSIFS